MLDDSAKQAYRERIQELHEDLEAARLFNDLGRVAKIEDEICIITRELARAVGLGGRDCKMGSQTEAAGSVACDQRHQVGHQKHQASIPPWVSFSLLTSKQAPSARMFRAPERLSHGIYDFRSNLTKLASRQLRE